MGSLAEVASFLFEIMPGCWVGWGGAKTGQQLRDG